MTRNETVDEVYDMPVTGAKVMLGVYPDGREELRVHASEPLSPRGAAWDIEDDLLPGESEVN